MDKDSDDRVTKLGNEHFFISPASESEARAHAVLPRKGSEDASRVLGKLPLPDKTSVDDETQREYGPNEANEWVITAQFDHNPRLNPKTVAGLFTESWREKYGSPTLFGKDADTGRWTFLIVAGGPTAVTQLKLGWDYCPFDDDAPKARPSDFQRRISESQRLFSSLGPCKLAANKSPEEAARHGTLLIELKRQFNRQAVLILTAPEGKPFNGRLLWDVMLSLGLRWGDMDCFHWENRSDIGGDAHFSVHTSTDPGYFFPEHLASGEMMPEDLVFSFSIPRSAAPLLVFDAMLRAVEYCQRRMGGVITTHNGEPVVASDARADIQSIASALTDAGYSPGSQAALMLF